MRFSINTLSELFQNEPGSDPMNEDVFMFIGKRSNQVWTLRWNGDGFTLNIKKPGQGILNNLGLRETQCQAFNWFCFYSKTNSIQRTE
ncbi:IS66 family insertion sequence element accessory protein TnpB [Cyclobacterium amurskyense]|uniref:IS66 family insertion sequence element accessory protein TnpB n=1 Tax=Cyclobacterium amurskyense TaxID=320787 RepID=UPI003C6CEA49